MKKLHEKLLKIQNELIQNREILNKLYYRGAMDTIDNILADVNYQLSLEKKDCWEKDWFDGDGFGY